MLEVIEITKYLSLDELIKHVWERKNYPVSYESESVDGGECYFVRFDSQGAVKFESHYVFYPETKFEYKSLKRVTGDMVFDYLLPIENDGTVYHEYKNSIDGILNSYSDLVQILAFVNGKYRVVWECEN